MYSQVPYLKMENQIQQLILLQYLEYSDNDLRISQIEFELPEIIEHSQGHMHNNLVMLQLCRKAKLGLIVLYRNL